MDTNSTPGSICQSLFHMNSFTEDGALGDGNFTMDEDNFTFPSGPISMDYHQMAYWKIRQIAYGYILPTLLAMGIVGNIINVAVFSQRSLWVQQDVMEKSAMIGLVSLAMADLMFCVIGFPSVFVEGKSMIGPGEKTNAAVIALYYTTYRGSILNIFVFMSTWFIVTLSVERYIAIAHPFQAKNFIRVGRTLLIKLIVIMASVVINIPDFLRYNIRYDPCLIPDCEGCYFAKLNPFMHKTNFSHAYSIVWHTVGTFLPLVMLTFCNVRLLMEIYKSTSHDKNTGASQSRDPTKITVILISIVTLFFVLVCPSMILSFLAECVLGSTGDIQYFQIAVVITNLGQALNFSFNFILYCAVSPKFRQGLKSRSCSKATQSSTLNSTSVQKVTTHAKSTSATSCSYELMDVPA